MNYKFLPFLSMIGTFCFAQNHFELKNLSEKYDASINIATCNEKECFGKAFISVKDKNTSEIISTISSENFTFNIERDSLDSKNIKFDEKQLPVIFEDFNFDGSQDIALINNYSRSNLQSIYDIYIFDSLQKQFLLNEGMTTLVKENSAMFNVDPERKRIIAHLKSGCCWNITKEYEVLPGRDPLKVYEFEEDTRDSETVITKKTDFIDYKWSTKTTKYPREVYYKDTKDENTKGN